MKQAVLLIDCYLYGTIAILAVVLLVLVYLHGQANHLPNPFARKNIVYTQMILFCLDEFASFGKLQITEALRKLRKRHIRIMVLTQSLADLDMIYGKDERKAMLGNFKFTVLLGCKDTETQEYFSKMIGDKRSPLETDSNAKPQPIIKPADLAHLEQDLFVICDDGAIRLRKNFYFK